MIKKWFIRILLLFCCLIWLKAVCEGVSLHVALIRSIFSGVLIFVLTVLFTMGLNALEQKNGSNNSEKNAANNKQDIGKKATKGHQPQIEPNLFEHLRDNPVHSAKLISKMTGKEQVKD
jgi:hypothetical protein